jgi:hypothetical protein
MSMFEDRHYRWRETYFVLFRSHNRPKLKTIQQALSALNSNYQLTNLNSDRRGRLESLTLISPDDFAALDICYTEGAEVLEQGAALAQEIKPSSCEASQSDPLDRLVQCDARFDVLHFEQVPEFPAEEDEADEMLDPSTLLLVLAELAKLTDGIAVDPQAGAILSDE